MVIYIDRKEVPDVENISNAVFRYLIEKAQQEADRYNKLYNEYLGREKTTKVTKDEVKVNVNYGKYVVDIVRGFFLGEPVKYDNNEKSDDVTAYTKGTEVKVNKKGKLVKHEWDKIEGKELDISPIMNAYDNQTISKIDSKIGKYMGIFGTAQELLYASDDTVPVPKSAVILPQNCILVQDNSIEHRDLFFMTYESRERVNKTKYYAVTVYTDKTEKNYESTDLTTFMFTSYEPNPHYFGEVPCVNYDNDDERQGDLEQIIPLSEAYSQLMSDRLTDKHKFIDAILAVYGFQLVGDDESGSEAISDLKENKLVDGIPTDGRIEYIQKVFDETSVKVLGDDLVRDLHKISMTIDMSDEAFSGNITGVALNMKFMPMNTLAKNKIRNMDEGLKKRFRLYNNWLKTNGAMSVNVPEGDIDVVFTIDMPQNLAETVDIIDKLKDRVDEQTLLALLPFVKDPAEMVKLVEEKKKENQKQFLDSFGNNPPDMEDDAHNKDGEEE